MAGLLGLMYSRIEFKALVADVKYPAVLLVDLDADAADQRSIFVFDDEVLIVSEGARLVMSTLERL